MNSAEALQKFIKISGGEDKIQKKFGYLTPIVLRYVQGVAEVCPNANSQYLEILSKLKIKMYPGEKQNFLVTGATYFRPSATSLNENHRSVKLYTRVGDKVPDEQKGINDLSLLDNPYELVSNQPEISESRFQTELDYCKTAIHELNHACSYQANIIQKRNEGLALDDDKIKKEDLQSNKIYSKRAGFTMVCSSFVNNKIIKIDHYLTNAMIHEGVTEYLAHIIFKTQYFKDLLFNKRHKGKNHATITYLPMYYFVGIMEVLYNRTLTEAYFNKINKSKEKNLKTIIDYVYNIFKVVEEIRLLTKKDDMFEDKLEILSKKLANEISICYDKICKKIEDDWGSYTTYDKKTLELCSTYFIKKEAWKEFIIQQCKLTQTYHNEKLFAPIEKTLAKKEAISIIKLDKKIKEVKNNQL